MSMGMVPAMGDHNEVMPRLGDLGGFDKQRRNNQQETRGGFHRVNSG
jgi:hypothetical protein